MIYKPLPEKLKITDKIASPKWYDPPEVLEVFNIRGDRIWLMRENGLSVLMPMTIDLLRAYDYQLVVDENSKGE